jgi:muramoyltetrapeptide carboxypeptidase
MPEPLKPGDTVGVAAPAGPPRSDWLEAGVDFLRSHSFEVVLGANIHKKSPYLAGTDQQRASDFNAMLRDPSVRAILLARGGYGTMRILRLLDLDALRKDPIIICGMSDGTALQLYLYRHLRLATLSGPMIAGQVAQRLDSWTAENFMEGLCTRWQGVDIFRDKRLTLRVARHGRCVGPLLGGCLSLVTALLGTHCLPDFSGAVLVLEDVSEPLYRLDRMITQLQLAGIFDAIEGLVLGYFLGPRGADFSREVEQMVLEITRKHDFPIVSGFPHGHRLPNLMFAHGLTGELDTAIPTLKLGA